MSADPRVERRRSGTPPPPPAKSENGTAGIWRWVAAIVAALLLGLTPYLLTQSAQKDYAQKSDVATVASSVVALQERVARNEEQIQQATDSIDALVSLAQTAEGRLSNIESVLARIEATLQATSAKP